MKKLVFLLFIMFVLVGCGSNTEKYTEVEFHELSFIVPSNFEVSETISVVEIIFSDNSGVVRLSGQNLANIRSTSLRNDLFWATAGIRPTNEEIQIQIGDQNAYGSTFHTGSLTATIFFFNSRATYSLIYAAPHDNYDEFYKYFEQIKDSIVINQPIDRAPPVSAINISYQGIFERYERELRSSASATIRGLRVEAELRGVDTIRSSTIFLDGISAIHAISDVGVSEMTNHMENINGPSEQHRYWVGKLHDISMSEAVNITEVSSALRGR